MTTARARAEEASDAVVVARVLAGDGAQFEVLMRRYNQRLYRAVRAIVRQDHEAEDVVQQTWVAAYRQLASFRGEASLATWLTRIAINEALGRARTRTRRGDVALVEAGDEAIMATTGRTPEDDASARELARLVEEQVDALPEAYRLVFVMRDVEELDTAETAACLGVTEETVRVRLHRARQMLQQALAERVGAASARVWRFDGERCDRIVHGVRARLGI